MHQITKQYTYGTCTPSFHGMHKGRRLISHHCFYFPVQQNNRQKEPWRSSGPIPFLYWKTFSLRTLVYFQEVVPLCSAVLQKPRGKKPRNFLKKVFMKKQTQADCLPAREHKAQQMKSSFINSVMRSARHKQFPLRLARLFSRSFQISLAGNAGQFLSTR